MQQTHGFTPFRAFCSLTWCNYAFSGCSRCYYTAVGCRLCLELCENCLLEFCAGCFSGWMSFSLPTDKAVFHNVPIGSARSILSLCPALRAVCSAHLKGPINLSTKHSFRLRRCVLKVSHILFVTDLESSRTYEKGARKTEKTTVTSWEISILGAKEEIPRCFCFASNHTKKGWERYLFPAARLGFCDYWNFDATESSAVSFISEERYLGDFFLTETENNQC